MDQENHTNYKVKLMCSYGGKIQCRPHDHALIYAGGDTKILTVDRTIKFRDMIAKLYTLCNCSAQFCLKYQLPGEDLDALISVLDDDDVEHMMVEYDRIHRISTKPARLRLFLFPLNWPVRSGPILTPDFLFGFDEYPDTSARGPVSDTRVGSEPETGVRGVAGDSYSREGHVTSGSYGFRAPVGYRIPVPGGGRPVYNFLPVMAIGQERRIQMGEHVAPNQTVKKNDAALNREF